MADVDIEDADTLIEPDEPRSSARLLAAIKKAERAMNGWQGLCDRIDEVYSRSEMIESDWIDPDYDLFWASTEILKPATYARPPQPVVTPEFKDQRPLMNITAELLERTAVSGFKRGGMDDAMLGTRDDLIFYNRGQIWLTYESDEKGGGQRVCIEHLDRKDFLHPRAREWPEVPWVARRAWMTPTELRKRFLKSSGDAYKDAALADPSRDNESEGAADHSRKASVWEVWHKADNRVYWVSEGVRVMLDEDEPHLKLRGFFPCPKPAYGTLRSRTLVPVPDYTRYVGHFRKINSLTARIYALLDMVRMKGLIPAGGDVGNAVEQAMADDDNASLLIPVPSAALMQGASSFVQWLPLTDIANAISGLIEARRELFSDYDRLSGISDIMRGETDADETLGAQRLKSQYGSVRVREKIRELQRIALDVTQITAEIMAQHFSKETLLEMAQMQIPSKADIERQVKDIEAAAKREMDALAKNAQEAIQQHGQQIDPRQAQQAQQGLKQAQQQIVQKYAVELHNAAQQVPIEDVMKLLRDDKARGFAFDIETDSTILIDEMEEKAARNEFMSAFTGAAKALIELAGLGEAGAKVGGEVLRFVLAPYRAGRQLNSVIDEFVDQAPQMAAQLAAQNSQGGGDADRAIAEANQKLAEAEIGKAQAAIAKVQADTQKATQETALKAQEAQTKAQQDQERFALEIEQTKGALAETQARIEKVMAEIQKMGVDAGNQTRQQDREDFKTAADVHLRIADQHMAAMQQADDMTFRAQEGQRAERQQAFSEQQGVRAEDRADRQQDFAERQSAP